GFPGIAVVVDYALADPKDRVGKVETVLAASADDPELHELAGQLLLARGEEKVARTRLQKSLELQPAHVRALVAVGEYFRRSGDYTNALEFYARAAKISPEHPGTILGAAESRLAMSQDLDVAVAESAKLPNDELLPEAMRPRRVLVRGRLLAATGKPTEAIELLREGVAKYKLQGFEFQLALADAFRRAGQMKDAETALEAALELRPDDEDAREALARVLIERGRARDALKQVDADPKSRRISLVRGLAHARLGDWKRARGELERTQVEGRYPSEAVVLLALADANEGQELRAREVLEKILSVTKKARGDVLVALGDIHLRNGEVDKARARFEQAAKEGDEPEGSCAWGRMLLAAGSPEKALEPLLRAVARNDSHDDAHEALARTYLQLGRVPDALKLTTRWQQTNKDSAVARRMHAWALFQSGTLKEADAAAWQSIREDSKVPEAWRIRAMVNFAQGDVKTGFAALERANELDPKDPETFCSIARAFLRQGNPEHAAAAFGAAVRERSDSVCGRLGMLWVKLPSASRSSIKEAEQLLRQSVSAWDKAFAHATVARMMLATGQAKEARARADEAIKLASWFGDAHLSRALVAAKLRDMDVAKTEFARAVELEPAHSGYRLEYADALVRGGEEDQQKAVEEYERFLRLGGSDRDEARVKRTLADLKRRLAAR
ncbi:MAG: tetratricopeptide repeat protein, partial [Myxococcaceae bacterium]